MDWKNIRAEFPALANWTYLNTATYGQVPRCAADAMVRHSDRRDELASTDFLEWYADADRVRASIARLIHAEPEDIAFVPNAAAALSIVLAGLAPAPGDTIVTLDDEFPNYLYQDIAQRVPWERFYDSIDQRTRLAAFSEVNYATGFRPPLAEVAPYLAARGVPLFLDGSQSVGALTFDVRKTPVDVLAVHGYKWLLSPTGAGFMYVSPAFRKKLPPNIVGWRSHRDWRNVDRLHSGTPEFKDAAEKYEGGGLPFHLIYAMEASVNWMLEIGPATIEQRVLELAASMRSMLRGMGASVEDTGSQVVIAGFPGMDASRVAKALREEHRVVLAARHGRLRVSPHFYNDEGDLGRLESALQHYL
ncbi:MAG TPA: aminotransferase class V-fold PLP-dependent enzyme [Bryobacteraceae bacterium]|jgi:selenocysteine lyase/cysteine desulfurase